ncbi:Lathosterol oxidase [Exaiptasia diaphana]|nr:Lathosterol oxidase [Exaiptasia diaphana]
MDLVLNFVDYHFFTPYVYPSSWSEDDMFRQILTLLLLANIGGVILYLATASFSFFFVFDRRLLQHPQILENQIYLEIMVALKSIPFMSLPTVALFMVEVRGYSRLHYISVSEIGLWRVPDIFKPFVNGSAHHTDHHTFFDYNYGQFFTLWDRIGGSFRSPTAFEGKAPIDYVVRNAPSKNKAS